MKIYFIIPVYNVERYLKRCIDSVLNQTYKDVCAILIDDGSKDNSGIICDDLQRKYDNIKVIHKENGGLSSSRNAGLDYLLDIADDNDFITFLDSDDFVRADFAERMIKLCVDNDCDAAQCNYEKGFEDSFTYKNESVIINQDTAENVLLGNTLKSMSCAKIYKFFCFKELRYPIGVLNEDEFTTYRAIYKCGNVIITSEELYYYFQHPGSIMEKIEKNMANNDKHLYDWLDAYTERIQFFQNENKPEQIQRTYEKICIDSLLRFCEQVKLRKDDRDNLCNGDLYVKIYRSSFRKMICSKHISVKRKFLYHMYYVFPHTISCCFKHKNLRK